MEVKKTSVAFLGAVGLGVLVLSGCPTAPPDAGIGDAGVGDAGAVGAGDAGVDAGVDAGPYTGLTCEEIVTAIVWDEGETLFETNTACVNVSECTTRPLQVDCEAGPDISVWGCNVGLHLSDVEKYESDLVKLTESVCKASFECIAIVNCSEVFSLQCLDGTCQNIREHG